MPSQYYDLCTLSQIKVYAVLPVFPRQTGSMLCLLRLPIWLALHGSQAKAICLWRRSTSKSGCMY